MRISNFFPCNDDKLNKLLLWTAEIDKMTHILRHTLLVDASRRENDAEHSWHIAVMALLFSEYAESAINVGHAVKMLVVHDLIEIYAGDTFAFDKNGNKTKKIREKDAADKLFSELPNDIGKEIRTLWEEFEEMQTNDAKYANCMDRLQPFLHNTLTDGHTWKEANATVEMVEKRTHIIKEFMPKVYKWIDDNIKNAVKIGWIRE